jgi:hypothetical protein
MRFNKKFLLAAMAVGFAAPNRLLAQNNCSFIHNLACITPESICWPAAIGSHEAYGQCLRKFDNGYCLPCAGFNDPKDCGTDNSDCKNFSGSVPSLWPSDPAGSFANSAAAQGFSGTASVQSAPGFSTGFATAGSLIVEAAIDPQKRVFYTWWIQGGAGKGWKELNGNGRAVSAPAIALSQTTLFAVIKKSDGYLYVNQGELAQAFTGWHRMPFQSRYAPAISTSMNSVVVVAVSPSAASSNGNTVVVVKDINGNMQYNWWAIGQGGHWQPTGDSLPVGLATEAGPSKTVGPSVTLTIDNYLFVSLPSATGKLFLDQGDLGKPFVGWRPQ